MFFAALIATTFASNEREADIIIVNTCSFIKEAKQESIDTILDLADRKHDAKCKLLVVTGCLPIKGLALPFVSYGGSSLVTAFVAIGIIVNIGMHVERPDAHMRAQLFDRELQEA